MHERFGFRQKNDLLGKAAELGLALPYSDDITPLLQPLDLAGFKIQNRLVVQPMEGYDSDMLGSPSGLTLRRYLRYTEGGSGIIWIEAVAISPEGRSNPNQLWINSKNINSYISLNEEIRKAALRKGFNPLLVVQLTHSGRYSKPDGQPRPRVAAENKTIDALVPHILTDEELRIIQDEYVEAARLCYKAGFDAIDLKACHGYLMIDLLSAKNRDGSNYGGSIEGRFRFLLQTIRRIKDELPEVLITTRLGISDMYRGGFGTAENNEPDFSEAIELTGQISEEGISLVNLSMGSPYFNPHITRPYDNPVPGQKLPDEHPLEGVVRLINATARFSSLFPRINFIGSGYSWLRQFAPNVGAEVIRRGYASFVGFGRSSFAYPSLPEDLRRNGQADPAKVCITCSGCTRLIRNLRPGGCVIRDKEIYGKELKKLIANGK
jgi:2,4-dienoyl-CoA reductase-like NADH-dependent reductase (Old Yellow Enzyme family)